MLFDYSVKTTIDEALRGGLGHCHAGQSLISAETSNSGGSSGGAGVGSWCTGTGAGEAYPVGILATGILLLFKIKKRSSRRGAVVNESD